MSGSAPLMLLLLLLLRLRLEGLLLALSLL